MKHIGRRELLRGTGVAALAAGAAVVPFAVKSVPVSEFAALVRLYFNQIDAFNEREGMGDKESEAVAASTYVATLNKLGKTPIRTTEDALALLDWMDREEVVESWCGDCEGVVESMVDSLRAHLSGVQA